MRFKVRLNIHQGAGKQPIRSEDYTVDALSPLSALCKAEDHVNVHLPDDQYAAARNVWPLWDPRPAAGEAMVTADAA